MPFHLGVSRGILAPMRWILLGALLGGCVHQADLQAWVGAPVRDLQLHPLFSALPKKTEQLGHGSELWTYSNCVAYTTPVTCSNIGGTVICSGGASGVSCCHNQLVVRGPMVEGYRVIGHCRTDCSVRPASRPCAEGATPQPIGNPRLPGG